MSRPEPSTDKLWTLYQDHITKNLRPLPSKISGTAEFFSQMGDYFAIKDSPHQSIGQLMSKIRKSTSEDLLMSVARTSIGPYQNGSQSTSQTAPNSPREVLEPNQTHQGKGSYEEPPELLGSKSRRRWLLWGPSSSNFVEGNG